MERISVQIKIAVQWRRSCGKSYQPILCNIPIPLEGTCFPIIIAYVILLCPLLEAIDISWISNTLIFDVADRHLTTHLWFDFAVYNRPQMIQLQYLYDFFPSILKNEVMVSQPPNKCMNPEKFWLWILKTNMAEKFSIHLSKTLF